MTDFLGLDWLAGNLSMPLGEIVYLRVLNQVRHKLSPVQLQMVARVFNFSSKSKRSSQIRFFTVCFSISTIERHYAMVEQL